MGQARGASDGPPRPRAWQPSKGGPDFGELSRAAAAEPAWSHPTAASAATKENPSRRCMTPDDSFLRKRSETPRSPSKCVRCWDSCRGRYVARSSASGGSLIAKRRDTLQIPPLQGEPLDAGVHYRSAVAMSKSRSNGTAPISSVTGHRRSIPSTTMRTSASPGGTNAAARSLTKFGPIWASLWDCPFASRNKRTSDEYPAPGQSSRASF